MGMSKTRFDGRQGANSYPALNQACPENTTTQIKRNPKTGGGKRDFLTSHGEAQ